MTNVTLLRRISGAIIFSVLTGKGTRRTSGAQSYGPAQSIYERPPGGMGESDELQRQLGKGESDMIDWILDEGYLILKILWLEVGIGRGKRRQWAAHLGAFGRILNTE